jgi:trk system potassium uptake protein TrkA
MFVIIAGGGRTGSQLAQILLNENHNVHLVEERPEVLARIHRELPTESIFEGNPIDPEVLESAGIKNADVLASVTTHDDNNLVLCYLAREKYHIPRTIARVHDPRNAWLFNDTFHVDVVVNQSEIMARLIEEEMAMGDMTTLLKLHRGNYSFVEEKLHSGSKAIGVPIMNMGLPDDCVIAAIIRQGKVIVPRGISTLEAGDELLAVVNSESAQKLEEILSPA